MGRNKLDHFMGKPEKVEIGEKEFTVSPKKNGELLNIMDELELEIKDIVNRDVEEDEEGEADKASFVSTMVEIIRERPADIIDMLVDEEFTQEDWLEAYPGQIAYLAVTFKDVNFTFVNKLKGLWSKIVTVAQNRNN